MKKNQFGGDAMKEILNPNKKTNDKMWNKKNLEDLKLIEEKKKRNKEQKEIENDLLHKNDQYKLEIFKNIPSKLKENTKNWVNNEKTKIKVIQKNQPLSKIRTKSQSKPMTSIKPNKPNKIGENIYNIDENEPKSMFDKYYANKLRSKSPSVNIRQNENNENNYNYEENENLNNDINNINNDNINNNDNIGENNGRPEIENLIKEYKEKYGSDEELEKMLNDYNNNLNINQPDVNIDSINKNNNNLEPIYQTKKGNNLKTNNSTVSNNNRRRDAHKGPTPTINDAPIILPKIHKNYIRENRQLVMEKKIPTKTKFIEEKNDAKHKDYGKVPEYIKKYELEREIRKEEIKKQEAAAKYPKGTKLLSEEERVETLNGLMNSKKELTNLLEKLPITTRTLAMQNKKDELIKKIEEVEKAIEMFSKKQVFIKA